jgi:hypothetical protein
MKLYIGIINSSMPVPFLLWGRAPAPLIDGIPDPVLFIIVAALAIALRLWWLSSHKKKDDKQ